MDELYDKIKQRKQAATEAEVAMHEANLRLKAAEKDMAQALQCKGITLESIDPRHNIAVVTYKNNKYVMIQLDGKWRPMHFGAPEIQAEHVITEVLNG